MSQWRPYMNARVNDTTADADASVEASYNVTS